MFLWRRKQNIHIFWLKKLSYLVLWVPNEPPIACSKICVTSKDSDQPVHLPSMARLLVYSSLDIPEAVERTCDQSRCWSDCADAQADLSLCWLHKSYCRFCCMLAHICLCVSTLNYTYQSCLSKTIMLVKASAWSEMKNYRLVITLFQKK